MTEQEKKELPKPSKSELTEDSQRGEMRNAAPDILQRLKDEAPDILSNLEEKQRVKLLEIVKSTQMVSIRHEGPIPPPEYIEQYNRHIPNGADRIMTMAEKQADHRREMERIIVTGQQKQSSRGQIFGLLIGIFGLGVGAVVTLKGHDYVGGGIAGATVVSLVYAFFTGQRAQHKGHNKPPFPSPSEDTNSMA